MRKDQKGAIVERLAENLERASIALISEYKGMTAGQSDDMRRRLRAVRGEFRVAKNTLVRRAIKDTRYEALGEKLGGPVGLILSYADPVELAKTVTSMRELGDKFKVRGGVLDGKALSAEEVQALAALPPREVIFAQLLGLLQAPATRLARLLNEPGSAMARLLDAISKRPGGSEVAQAAGGPGPVEGAALPVVAAAAPPAVEGAVPPAVEAEKPPTVSSDTPPVVAGSAPPVVEGAAPSAVEGATPPPVEGAAPPAVEAEKPPAVASDTPPAVEGAAPPAVEGAAPPAVEAEKPVEGETPPTIKNGMPTPEDTGAKE
jgi:large subunit ribosomal protein L10